MEMSDLMMFGLMMRGEFAVWLVMSALALVLFLGFLRAIHEVRKLRKQLQEKDKRG